MDKNTGYTEDGKQKIVNSLYSELAVETNGRGWRGSEKMSRQVVLLGKCMTVLKETFVHGCEGLLKYGIFIFIFYFISPV